MNSIFDTEGIEWCNSVKISTAILHEVNKSILELKDMPSTALLTSDKELYRTIGSIIAETGISCTFYPKLTGLFWANGREQGYYLLISYHKITNPIRQILMDEGKNRVDYWRDVGICFAEARNSDEIVIVYGTDFQFDLQTNQPKEVIWNKNRRYVTAKKASSIIVDIIIEQFITLYTKDYKCLISKTI